jgi:hypothetical protein
VVPCLDQRVHGRARIALARHFLDIGVADVGHREVEKLEVACGAVAPPGEVGGEGGAGGEPALARAVAAPGRPFAVEGAGVAADPEAHR